MIVAAAAIWVVGLVLAVPYATYHLLFEAPRDQYAALIVFIGFWVFGYWGLVGPVLMAVKVRRIFRAIESAKSGDDLRRALANPDLRDVAIDMIAADNHLPRFVAARIHARLVARLGVTVSSSPLP